MADVNIKVSIVSGQAKASLRALQGEANKLEKDVKGVNIAVKNSTSAFKVFAGVVTGQAFLSAIRGLSTGMLNFARSSVQAASDAEETASKFGVVFKAVGDEAEAAANKLITSFGLSRNESKELLASTGDLLTGFGFTGDAALDLSAQVQELAVDLASFTNFSGGAKGASEALTKALLGERESVKSLGISILEEDVKKQVAINTANGLTFATERQAKAQATLDIALRQSANALGDFGRTSESFANQQRILDATINDVLTAIGTEFLPIVTNIITETNKWIRANESLIVSFATEAAETFAGAVQTTVDIITFAIGIYDSFNKFLKDNEEAINAGITAMTGASIGLGIYAIAVNAAAISSAIAATATTALAAAIAFVTSPITIAIAVIVGLGAAAFTLVKIWNDNSDAIKSFAADMIESLIPAVDATLGALGAVVGIFSNEMAASIETAKGSLRSLVETLREEKTVQDEVIVSLENTNTARATEAEKSVQIEKDKLKRIADERALAAAKQAEADAAAKEFADAQAAADKELELINTDAAAVKDDERLTLISEQLGEETALKLAAQQRNAALDGRGKIAELRTQEAFNKAKNEIDKTAADEALKDKKAFFASATSLQSSGNRTLVTIGKAAALAEIAIATPPAVIRSFNFGAGIGGPVLGGIFGAIAAAAGAAQAAKVAGVNFQAGGIVPGNSLTGDRVSANLNSGEAVLNRSQQTELLGLANGNRTASGGQGQEIVVNTTIQLEGETIARAVSRQVADGFELGKVV